MEVIKKFVIPEQKIKKIAFPVQNLFKNCISMEITKKIFILSAKNKIKNICIANAKNEKKTCISSEKNEKHLLCQCKK